MIQFDEEKHSEAAMLLDLEDSLGVMGSGELMKSLVFFDIGKLEAELVQIVKQEEVCTLLYILHGYGDSNFESFIFFQGLLFISLHIVIKLSGVIYIIYHIS